MKDMHLRVIAAALLAMVLIPVARAANETSALGVGGRYHSQHSAFAELPFDDGDLSYGLAYEYHEEKGLWQIAVEYCPEPGGVSVKDGVTNLVDYVVTPQLSLILKDNIWRGGVGAMASYIEQTDSGEAEWTSVYWQFLLGIGVPLGMFDLDVMASYPFEDWDTLSDFDADEMEYVAWLKLSF